MLGRGLTGGNPRDPTAMAGDLLISGGAGAVGGGLGQLRAVSPAGQAADDAVDVFRAVGPDETADIAQSGVYRNPAGLEGKYFYPTREQAENLGQMYTKAGIGGPYSITSGTAPRSVIEQAEPINPVGEGPAWFFRNDQLPSVSNATIHGPIP